MAGEGEELERLVETVRQRVVPLRVQWEQQADALEELSSIENGGEPSEVARAAAAALRRCAQQLRDALSSPLEQAVTIAEAPPPTAPPKPPPQNVVTNPAAKAS